VYCCSEILLLTVWLCAGDAGHVAGSAASVVVRPIQSAVQQQVVMNAANTSSSVPVFCPPNFPTIQQALRGAAHASDQPVSGATTSTITTATASVVPDPAVVKTLLASKLARNMSHQQQTDVNSVQSSTGSVPSSSSVTCVSTAASASDVSAVNENLVDVSAADVVESASKHSIESNGLTDTLSSTLTSSTTTVSLSSCLANGHTKQLFDPSALMNGICSPAPSCSSEDQEPLRSVKVPKSPGYTSECDRVVVNGDIVDNEVGDDDDDDDMSELNDCDGDVLVKAMMHADILDCGGRPAVTDNSCDDDSRLSADFLSGFVELTEEQVSTADAGTSEEVTGTDTAVGVDSETAAAVADLLHETGMMADDEGTVSSVSAGGNDNCLSLDFDARVSEGDNECAVSVTSDAPSFPTDDQVVTSTNVDNSSVAATILGEQLDCQTSTADVTEQMLGVKPEPHLVATSFVGPSIAGSVLACSAEAVSASLPSLSSSAVSTQPAVSSVPAAAQLQNGVMVVPPRGISLPSGQFISGGTRLLIRPITSVQQAVSSTPSGSLPVRLTHPAQGSVVNAQSDGTVAGTSSSLVVDASSQLPGCSVTSAAPVRFVSSTTSQGQLIIQRAQILSSNSSPMIQRVLLPQTPRPIAMRSEGQTILQASQANQQMSSRPMLLTQAPFRAGQLGQLRVAGPGMQLVSGSSATPAQIVLQSGHVISVQPQQPSTHDVAHANHTSDQLQLAASSNLPVLAAKPGSDQTATSQTPAGDVTSSQLGTQTATGVKPPLRPLISTSQQPIQIVGGPLQLRAGLVGLPTGTGSGPVILQHGGRPILLQSPNVGSAQHPSSYVVFRPGPLPVPSSQEHNASAVSSSSSVGPDMASRKRPLMPSSATVSRSLRKKTRKDEDSGLPFICEWSGCQR